jgi:DASS family divalent anion:Na+ symporter
LILCGAHANLLSSTFFITSAGPNPIIVELAHKILNINYSFTTWFAAAFLPGMVSMLILPLMIFKVYNPKYDGRNVISEAESQLKLMGQTTMKEIQLLGILLFSLLLWSTNKFSLIPETLTAYLAFVSLLQIGVVNWKDILSNHVAWDTFFWLSGMLTLADQLSRLGVAKYFGELSADYITQYTDSTTIAALLLCLSYCLSMYFFSSITGHAIAIGGPLMAAGKSIGCSPWLVTALMACFSSLSACLTTFSTGSVVLYYSQGFFTQGRWFMVGHLVIAVYFLLYGTVGMVWWKILGYY